MLFLAVSFYFFFHLNFHLSFISAEVVELSGIVSKQWGPTYPGMRCHVGLSLQATSLTIASARRGTVEVTPEAERAFQEHWQQSNASGMPLAARDAILSSFCPQLCGLFSVKLASMLMLIGGVPRQDASEGASTGGGSEEMILGGGRSSRGEIHFLLVGDPGTGKSQIQRYVSRLAPRAVLTSGQSSSAAGLTAAAVKDGAGWTLEGGALVLADGGVCCIDEFDSVREADRAALHEAMEQQTCSIAKAGMLTTLHTRTAVFGTCNPKGNKRYNPRRPLSEQLAIAGPLLSRFDVVLLLIDDLNPVWDEEVADHILAAHSKGGGSSAPGSVGTPGGSQGFAANGMTQSPSAGQPYVGAIAPLLPTNSPRSVDNLRQYIAWVKQTFHPVLTPPAEEVLSKYYQLRRGAAGRHAARTTLRLLESLVRLAQAHARLMARATVEVVDAAIAVALVDSSVVDGESVLALGPTAGLAAPGDRFHDRPDDAYPALEAAVLAAVRDGGGAPATGLLAWRGGGGGDWG